MKLKRNLFWQIFPTYLGLALLALLGAALISIRSIHGFYLDRVEAEMASRAGLLSGPVLNLVQQGDALALDRFCKAEGHWGATRITVLNATGKVLGDSEENPDVMDNHRDRPEVRTALAGGTGQARRWSHTLETDMLYAAIPLHADGRLVAVLRTAMPLATADAQLAELYHRLIWVAVGIAMITLLVSYWLAQRLTGPLRQMQQQAEKFAGGDFSGRLRLAHSPEIDRLAEALNRMAAALDDQIKTILRQKNELAVMLTGMQEGVIAVDRGGRILKVNPAAGRMFDLGDDTVEGRLLLEAVRNPMLEEIVSRVMATSVPVEEAVTLYHGGKERLLQVHGTILPDAAGVRNGVLLVVNDLTRLRRLENLRREFVANVSHELRTPITAIKGYAETLLDGAMRNPAEAERFLAIIAANAERLGAIIEDLLLLSRLDREEAAAVDVLKESCPVSSLLQAVVQAEAGKAETWRITVTVDCPAALAVPANATLLQQALVNLLDNALNYSEPGSRVQIRAWTADQETAIAVQDWGCGMAPEHHARIFERFYRVDKARSRDLGGTGLGLAIVKHIVQVHGGRVTVESAPGHGSTFTLFLPQ